MKFRAETGQYQFWGAKHSAAAWQQFPIPEKVHAAGSGEDNQRQGDDVGLFVRREQVSGGPDLINHWRKGQEKN